MMRELAKRIYSCHVSVLFVQSDGCYANKKGIDAWDEKRDAKKYKDTLPVIAHPPCQLWGNLAFVNYKRWGGEHNKPENDSGCFKSALDNVNRCGGVLEHPAKTRAFKNTVLKNQKVLDGKKAERDGYVKFGKVPMDTEQIKQLGYTTEEIKNLMN